MLTFQRDLSASDFSHPLLGDVIRADTQLRVKPEIGDDLLSDGGEWGGLQHASQMISRRFPSLARGYMYHVPKTLSVSLMHEASVMWEDELTEAATRGFRRSARGMGDVEISWLVGFLRVERWREALLWSWAVARMGGESGLWTEAEREELKRVLKMGRSDVDYVTVHRAERSTLVDMEGINLQMGWASPRETHYGFCERTSNLDRSVTDAISLNGRRDASAER
jgi:3-O-alpha-D-mannopyranosyl-alpha-D-mannopyranose xylosylphosphotransferase